MPSKYYTEERECNQCGDTYSASYLIGVRRPMNLYCNDCSSERKEKRIDRGLSEHPDAWYRPDSEEYDIAVYKPNGDRRYYRHDLHAVQRIERWYGGGE
jgi:hypothetical protein